MRQLLDHAAKHRYGASALSIWNMELGFLFLGVARICDAQTVTLPEMAQNYKESMLDSYLAAT